jgi:protein ImuA
MSQNPPESEGPLEHLLRHAKVWRAGEVAPTPGISTDFPVLDGLLPNHGWPPASLTEILTQQEGIGALRLVLPALARLSRTQWVVWICPPYVPYVPALQAAGVALERMLIVEPDENEQADIEYMLWVFEQALRFVDCGVAMAWIGAARHARLRRLQLACELGQTWGVMFRPESCAIQASPAVLRLSLVADAGKASVRILKSRGGSRTTSCQLDL